MAPSLQPTALALNRKLTKRKCVQEIVTICGQYLCDEEIDIDSNNQGKQFTNKDILCIGENATDWNSTVIYIWDGGLKGLSAERFKIGMMYMDDEEWRGDGIDDTEWIGDSMDDQE